MTERKPLPEGSWPIPESEARVETTSVVADDRKESGLDAETVWESDIGDSDLEAEDPVSDVNGEYFLTSGDLVSIVRTRLLLLETTLAVWITGASFEEAVVPLANWKGIRFVVNIMKLRVK